MAVCKYHPERAGVGVCMRCRAVVCVDCTTRLHGINHCHACLRELANAREERGSGAFARAALTLVMIVVGWLPLFLLIYLLQGRMAP